MPYRILVADDQVESLQAVVALLRGLDAQVEVAYSGSEALRQLLAARFDLSLLDMHMPGLTGLEVMGQLRQMGQLPPSILMTGNPSREIELAALEMGAVTMLRKPIPGEMLRIVVEQVITRRP